MGMAVIKKLPQWLRLKMSVRLRHVPRWTVMPTIHTESVAEHTYIVVQILRYLLASMDTRTWPPEKQLEALECALDHDLEESIYGDSPSPVNAEKKPKPSGDVEVLVKFCDWMAALIFLEEEGRMGNTYTEEVAAWRWQGVHRLIKENPEVFAFNGGAPDRLISEIVIAATVKNGNTNPITDFIKGGKL